MVALILVLGAAACAGPALAAPPFPLDPEDLQVNTLTFSFQKAPAVAVDPEGDFVVVWESRSSLGDDSYYSVQRRRFAASGAALDPAEFQVNTYTNLYQEAPAVAFDSTGGFVVVWESYGSPGSDSSYESVQARRFAADGSPLDAVEFQVNTYTTDYQSAPAVARAPAGTFVVVWQSYGAAGGDTSAWSIQARRYAADGTPLDPAEFQVNTYTTSYQTSPAVAVAPSGAFLVAWERLVPQATKDLFVDGEVYARRFAADGTPLDPDEFRVNSYTTSFQLHPAIAVDGTGRFIVAWESWQSAGTDSDLWSIQARRFASDGTPLDAADFQVNTYTTSWQANPAVAVDGDGTFTVVWDSTGSPGDDDFTCIQTRRFAADGSALDAADFQVNTYTSGLQEEPSVAAALTGQLVLAWGSTGSTGGDNDEWSVQRRRFGAPNLIFQDGFESGDMSRWSAAVP